MDSTSTNDTNKISIHLAEYSALRNELISFQGLEYQAIQFAILVITAIAGLIVQVKLAQKVPFDNPWHTFIEPPWILFESPPFLLLGSLFAYAQFKVMLVALYLNENLRPKLIDIVHTQVLDWEENRRDALYRGNKGFSEFFSAVRWALFIWPLVPLLWGTSCNNLGTGLRLVLVIEIVLFSALFVLAAYCWYWLPRSVKPVHRRLSLKDQNP